MKYTVCTTFSASGYEKYGRRMIQTFLQNWPQEVNLVVYAENCMVSESAVNLVVHDLETASPDMVTFKQNWGLDPRATGQGPTPARKDAGKTFKWDAIRFCHKVYAVCAAAKTCQTDWLIWMDADMVCHKPIMLDTITQFVPNNQDLCFLGRCGKFSECGLYAMNLTSEVTGKFLADFKNYYDHPESGIFTLAEWHDSFVFDAVRKRHALRELDWTGHIITGEGHPLINSAWGRYLDHLKGDRKNSGKSWSNDFKVQRNEPYWQNLQRGS